MINWNLKNVKSHKIIQNAMKLQINLINCINYLKVCQMTYNYMQLNEWMTTVKKASEADQSTFLSISSLKLIKTNFTSFSWVLL